MLRAAGVRAGRFTSPHLVDRWDCITIDDRPVDEFTFREVEEQVMQRNRADDIGASEFELLTATAFEVFGREKVEIAVVEVGMGGRSDATNILMNPLVTVVTKIGLDHQLFLGKTLEAIAAEKGGIMKVGVPCVVDATNPPSVLSTFEALAAKTSAGPILRRPSAESDEMLTAFPPGILLPHQRVNLSCALTAVQVALDRFARPVDLSLLVQAARKVDLPGRLQMLSLERITGRTEDVLLDGAHNPQAAEVLHSFVASRIRRTGRPVTWVLAAAQGKDLGSLFEKLVQPGDHVVAVEFGLVDGMPWVLPTPGQAILDALPRSTDVTAQRRDAGEDVRGALQSASDVSAGGALVIAGSLYLVSEVLRLVRAQAS
ncbi:MAG: folylpolyglutamate synthase [Thelocarpon superellum]|nr:MAG: folylpolyglutamate synthase [Thelocarpon superellum]